MDLHIWHFGTMYSHTMLNIRGLDYYWEMLLTRSQESKDIWTGNDKMVSDHRFPGSTTYSFLLQKVCWEKSGGAPPVIARLVNIARLPTINYDKLVFLVILRVIQ